MNRRACNDELPDQPVAELAALKIRRDALTATLCLAAQTLLDTGRPPSVQVIDELRTFRAAMEGLKSLIMAAEDDMSSRESASGEVSLTDIEEELNSSAIIRNALQRLEQVSMICHVEREEFVPLQRCLVEGSRLREELLSAPSSRARVIAEQFLSDEVPLNAVVTLVTDGPELSDKCWSVLLDSVSAAYGREISTAIARGKLKLQSGARA